MNAEDAGGQDEVTTSWKSFWNASCRDLEQDLPNWPGAPLRAVWIRKFDGNDSKIIVQKDVTTYYVVCLSTS